MTKIVYNRCYGGFSLSEEATERYGELLGKKVTKGEKFCGFQVYLFDGERFYSGDLSRTDPLLIQVIEELGSEKASGLYAKLDIEELPSGCRYRITEYDGFESIETDTTVDWSVA